MKYRCTKNVIFALGIVLLLASCEKNKVGDIAVSDIHFSDCKNHTDRMAKADPMWGAPDSVSVRFSNGTAYITHYNLLVNCGFAAAGVMVDINVEGSTITINEHENPNGPQANCLCAIDNSFQINNLSEGSYTLVFENWYPEPYSMTYTF